MGSESLTQVGLSAFLGAVLVRANVYIDGFNLYYGLLKGTDFRWLNLSKFCRLLLPKCDVQRIKYFTARVRETADGRQTAARQQIYLRALATLPDVDVFYGRFNYQTVRMPRANGSGMAEVRKVEEKGSDVALAVHAVHDAHTDQYDAAVVISNDTDLIPALEIIRNEVGKQVHILFPTSSKRRRWPCDELKCTCDAHKEIRNWALREAQFADILTDAVGDFHKPVGW